MTEDKNANTNLPQPAANDRALLLGLMSLAGAETDSASVSARRPWSAHELAAVWRHQMSAPLLLDLGGINDQAMATVTMHAQSAQRLENFPDLMAHPHPPIELLQLTKDFAKSQRYSQGGAFPVEIASALYYAAIVLARLRLGQRITEMGDDRLRQGVQWSLQQPWLDATTKSLFAEANAKFGKA
jgi:hypothetical protein